MLKEFILQYLSGPALRMRIRRGLLKVEQMHALARDLLGSGADRIVGAIKSGVRWGDADYAAMT